VPRHGYYVIFKAVSGISLNNSRDSLTLYRPDGSIADAADYQKNPGNEVTFCYQGAYDHAQFDAHTTAGERHDD
jgi:hypothetical protein